MIKDQKSLVYITVLVGALGFFVDIYDLLLFGIVRKPSLVAIGLSPDEILSSGEWIISMQMIGLVVGGIFWGIVGDKKGRLKVLFGSILIYSLANIANGFVRNVPEYILLRFIAGIGLAGELGASITLTSEMMPKEKRGLAASIIASVGVLGAVTAYLVYKSFGDWRLCYFIGGAMGLFLLLLRAGTFESQLFGHVVAIDGVKRGSLSLLFATRERTMRYVNGVLIGLPVWYVIGILITFSDEFGRRFGLTNIDPGKAITYQYIAIGIGDISAGLLSNYLRSRKKALFIFLGLCSFFIVLFFLQAYGTNYSYMYSLIALLGFGSGFSVLYITMSAEQFGTNLRATTAISIPNVVRGCLPMMLLLFRGLRSLTGDNYLLSAEILGAFLIVMAVIAGYNTKETFMKEMDFLEE